MNMLAPTYIPGYTWRITRADQLKPNNLIKLPNPPFARVVSVNVLGESQNYSEWAILEIQLSASEWMQASGGMDSMFVIVRRRFEAIEVWDKNYE